LRSRITFHFLQGTREHFFQPFDLAVDPISRVLFWTCQEMNSVNMTKMDDESSEEDEEGDLGSIIRGGDDRPRSIAVHSRKSLLFFVNMAPPVRIERCNLDGTDRKIIISTSVLNPTDLAVDATTNTIYWTDSDLKRVESSDLNGAGRRVLATDGIIEPVALAVRGGHVYWADRGGQGTIARVDKATGGDPNVVKTGVKHLSSLVSVSPLDEQFENPCLEAKCSHLCLVTETSEAKCACPEGTGQVLSVDLKTCGLPPTCKPDEFTCTFGTLACIPLQWRCDGQSECSDHSDEMNCPECGANQFRCRSGQCVNGTLLCDGSKDCDDSTDELSCCKKNHFRCVSSGECVERSKTCDGANDCKDGSDEMVAHCSVDSNAIPAMNTGADGGGKDNSTAAIVSVLGVISAIVIVVGFIFYWRKSRVKSDPSPTDDVIPVPVPPQHRALSHPPRHLTSVAAPSEFGGPGSSNGAAYDRNHLTGASSSAASSCYPMNNPPPSVTTEVRRQYRSSGSTGNLHLHRQNQYPSRPGSAAYQYYTQQRQNTRRMPPPTPCSTDVNEESDCYAGHGSAVGGGDNSHPRQDYPHNNSAANSTYGGGYESDLPLGPATVVNGTNYGTDDDVFDEEEDLGGADEEEASALEQEEEEESVYLMQQMAPPPSRVPSPAPLK
jgi:low density lipoprotein receptor-related protein 5/6